MKPREQGDATVVTRWHRSSTFWRIAVLFTFLGLLVVACWSMIGMPGKSFHGPLPPLSAEQIALRGELVADVQKLAGEIGERNVYRYAQLQAAADFIEQSFTAAGLHPRRDSYEMGGKTCDNIEAEIAGTSDAKEIIVVGAHYDSVLGSPAANDNGSGVAATLALARRFAGKPCARTLRFVAFVNEEAASFQTDAMGSMVYASRCKARGDRIVGMISLETIGYFTDEPGSQNYPAPGLDMIYPSAGNYISFVGDLSSRALVKAAIGSFRRHAQFPSEGAALPSSIPGIGWSDHWAFWQHGYPAIMITDTAPFRYPFYHTAKDLPDKLDYDSMTRVVSGIEKVISDLAE
ncbi:M28 family peptidase [Verrucomicrobiota bacterium sgz303538]